MNATADFLARLRALDIRLSLDGDRLNCSAPKGVLTADLRAELAARKGQIVALLRESNGSAADYIGPVARHATLPLSPAQRRIWFLQRYAPDSHAYNIPLALRLRGPLDARLLATAFGATVERHEPLRMVFEESEGAPHARILPAVDWSPDVYDWSECEAADFDARLQALAREVALTPFDLGSSPLLRVIIVRRRPDEHGLILVVHRIIADSWSLGILLRDAGAAYQRQVDPPMAPVPALPVQFADYLRWLEGDEQRTVTARRLGYWQQQLSGPLPVMEIPSDRPRPPIATTRGTRMRHRLEQALAESVRACGHKHGTTVFVVLLAAFKLLLHRYTQQHDIVVGSEKCGRTRAELEPLVGPFVDTLVLRTRVEGSATGHQLIEHVHNVVREASDADVPFEHLATSLAVTRDLSYAPLVQVMFTLQNHPVPKTLLPDVSVDTIPFDTGISRLDLTVEVFEHECGLELEFEYNSDLFDPDTIARLQVHYEQLLTSLVAAPERPVGELPMLTGPEVERLLGSQNATRVPYAHRSRVHELVERALTASPDRIAVRCGDDVRSRSDVWRQSKNVAAAIRRHGLGAGNIVAVCLERSADMPAVLLGVLRSGAAYVPVDPIYPSDRIEYMLADSGAQLILAHRSVSQRLPNDAAVLWVDEAMADDERESADPTAGSSDDLAYVIYTSGSTGRPKGVEITHRSLVNFLQSMRRCPGLDEHDRLLAVTTLCFDIAGLEMYLPLLAGAELVIAAREEASDPDRLRQLLEHRQITVMQATPSTWRMLLDTGWRGRAGFRVLCGGEALTRDLADRLCAANVEVWNLYGPTETTIWSTVQQIDGGPVTVGRPIANTSAYVLDGNQQLLPIGVPGELYIGGDGVARGYRNRPDLTAERFVPDPFVPGARLYRTGDLARWTRNGTLELLGRVDRQVKLRGFRIELGEIESALREIEGVREAVVKVDGPTGAERLVAYVTLTSGATLDSARARTTLARRLPDYMVPAVVVTLPRLPLTPNNKVDVKALPAPEQVAATDTPFTPASNTTEQQVADIWRALLRVERVGRDDNFFDLGGHSLLLVQLQNRLQAQFGAKLTLGDLFKRPTVAGIASLVELRCSAPAGVPTPEPKSQFTEHKEEIIQPAEGTRPSPEGDAPPGGTGPLALSQQRLWFLDRLEGGPTYNLAAFVWIDPADPARLESAIRETARRHEPLRTSFADNAGEPIQIVHADLPVHLRVLDSSAVEGVANPDDAVVTIVRDLSAEPFDLQQAPLFRAALIRTGSGRDALAVVLHHIIADGLSLGLFFSEVQTAYNASSGEPSRLPELTARYADYVRWQRDRIHAARLDGDLHYWRTLLSGAPKVTALPLDHPRPPVQDFRGGSHAFSLGADLSAALKQLARSERLTMYMMGLSVLQTLLFRYTGQDTILVGTPVSQRTRLEFEPLIGMFVNTLVMRADFSAETTGRALMRQVRDRVLDAHEHADVPFERLVEELRPDRTRAHSPLFQVSFAYENAIAANCYTVSQTAMFDLGVFIWEDDEGVIRGGLQYSRALFEPETAARLAAHFVALAGALVRNADARLTELELLSEEERHRLLVEWNPAPSVIPDCRIDELFFEQAAETPHQVAVVETTAGATETPGALTYAELARQARAVAATLRESGVVPGDRVGIFIERSADAIVAVLGTLSAGATYVPLDPSYPESRLDYMIADAGIRVLLTRDGASPKSFAGTVVDVRTAGPRKGIAPAPPTEGGADALAYVMYTSGSTGEPKGVCVAHRSVIRLVKNTNYVELGPTETLLACAPVSFDAATFESWGALLNGGTLVVLTDAIPTPATLRQAIAKHRITTLWLTAGLFHQIVDADVECLAGVRQLLAGGDVLSVPHVNRFLALPGEGVLINGYGPTENTTFTTCHRMARGTVANGPIPIGRPIANTTAYILDSNLRPVPVGVVGELYTGGDGVALGYLNRPELTSERFLADPFRGRPGARMYRTGDLARWLPDGTIQFLGRRDTQVKVRGFRIELEEIEGVVARHPQVLNCVMSARTGADGEKYLACYVVMRTDTPNAEDALRAHVAAFLPEYMVPSAFVRLDALPLGPNGKVDRGALPEPAKAANTSVLPRTRTEAVLLGHWRVALNAPTLGITDNFFDQGGHSLLAVKLFARLEADFGNLPLSLLFEAPTVEQMARKLDARSVPKVWRALVPIKTSGRRPPLFLVPGIGGNVVGFAEVAAELGPDQPVFGLQSLGLDGVSAPLTRVEDIAALFIEEVRAMQPTGPYHFAGQCMGGVIALEMAQQLRARGEHVELLTLVETWPPAVVASHRRSAPRPFGLRSVLARCVEAFATLKSADPELRRVLLRQKLSKLRRVLRREQWRDIAEIARERVERANYEAFTRYEPRYYDGKIRLVLAEGRPVPPGDDPRLYWQKNADACEIYSLPGKDSGALFRRQVAAQLARYLSPGSPAFSFAMTTMLCC